MIFRTVVLADPESPSSDESITVLSIPGVALSVWLGPTESLFATLLGCGPGDLGLAEDMVDDRVDAE